MTLRLNAMMKEPTSTIPVLVMIRGSFSTQIYVVTKARSEF